jgi:hypothetical protein
MIQCVRVYVFINANGRALTIGNTDYGREREMRDRVLVRAFHRVPRDGEGEGEGESFPALTRTLVVPSLLKASKSVRFENILILYSCPFPRARGWGILFI